MEDNNRRDFLKKTTAVTAVVVDSGLVLGFSQNKKEAAKVKAPAAQTQKNYNRKLSPPGHPVFHFWRRVKLATLVGFPGRFCLSTPLWNKKMTLQLRRI